METDLCRDVYGVVSVQSYDARFSFSSAEQNMSLLFFLSRGKELVTVK